MASREGSRKRLKRSRQDSIPSISTAPIIAKAEQSAPTPNMPAPIITTTNPHEQTLKTLQTDVEAMRQLVTCKICDRLLYEPYALSCGHTYCYSCLTQWFVANKKKTCPDCRAVITQQPTPSYIVRELVLVFTSRTELLPDGETMDEHNRLAQEEAKIVTDDRDNADARTGGLFKGCFSRANQRRSRLYDPGDGVDRCPDCHWELEEDGFCEVCGRPVDGEDYLDITDTDGLSDFSEHGHVHHGADGADEFYGRDDFSGESDGTGDTDSVGRAIEAASRRAAHRPAVNRRRARPIHISSDEESSDDEEDENLEGFVVGDDHIDPATSDDDDLDDDDDTDVPSPNLRRGSRHPRSMPPTDSQPVPWSDSPSPPPFQYYPAYSSVNDQTSEEDEDDGPVLPIHRRRAATSSQPTLRSARYSDTVTNSSTFDEDEEEDDRTERDVHADFYGTDEDDEDTEREDRESYNGHGDTEEFYSTESEAEGGWNVNTDDFHRYDEDGNYHSEGEAYY